MCFALAAMSPPVIPSPPIPTPSRALLLAERAHHAEELESLTAIIKELQRHRFGRLAEFQWVARTRVCACARSKNYA